jgi:glycosyltransferase involved in cell wall biosynthesis
MVQEKTHMKKVLILAYEFPPYISVGGMRPYSWHKYFLEFGIYPVVVTRQWSNKYGNFLDYVSPGESSNIITEESDLGTILRTPYFPNLANRILIKYGNNKFKYIRKLISAFYEIFQYFFITGTKKELYKGAKEYLSNNKVDYIIATGEPFVLFKYASKLSRKYNTPWIADYRDEWSQSTIRTANKFLRKIHRYNEKKFLKNVSLITTVSDFIEYKISSLIKNKPIKIIYNGYDPDNIEKVKEIEQNHDSLQIAYAGTIYNWNPIASFLEVYNAFIKETPIAKIQLNFYGINIEEKIKEIINIKFPELNNYISFFPKLSNQKLLESIASQNVLLLFNYFYSTGTKIYEYMALKRCIIMCYSEEMPEDTSLIPYFNEKPEGISTNKQADLINETNSGIVVRDSKHLLEVITELYQEFSQTGKIKCDSTNTELYSRKKQAEMFTKIINNK